MRRKVKWPLMVGMLLALGQAPAVRAWGPEGHDIVCRIALGRLTATEQAAVDDFVEAYTGPEGYHFSGLATACNFADDARLKDQKGDPDWVEFRPLEKWHFLNLSRSAEHVGAGDCNNNCVLEGISRHSAELANEALSKAKRGRALILLAHWVGDVHQPLHVSYKDDLGGNEIKPIHGGYYYFFPRGHLHQVWDSRIINEAMGNQVWWKYADELTASVKATSAAQWLAVPQLGWAEESYAITISDPVDYCAWKNTPSGRRCVREPHKRTLTAEYQETFAPYVELRLQQAGVRLADLIRKALQ